MAISHARPIYTLLYHILPKYTSKYQDSHLAYIYPQVPGLSSCLYIPPSAKTLILPIYTSSARTLILPIYTPKCQDCHLAYIHPPSAKTLILPIYTLSARTLICIIQRLIIDDAVNIPKSQDLY